MRGYTLLVLLALVHAVVALEILGTGLGRTGTLSLKTALEILNKGPVMHMTTLLENQKHGDKTFTALDLRHYSKLAKLPLGKESDELTEYLLGPFTSGVDYPVCLFWKPVLHKYPNAKVILTVRDSPRVWAESAVETIFGMRTFERASKHPVLLGFLLLQKFTLARFVMDFSFLDDDLADYDPASLESMEKYYVDHLTRIREDVPKKQLLEFNVKQGWKPLCEFLGKPVPDVPFPRSNDRGYFHSHLLPHAIGGYVVVALEIYFVFWLCKRALGGGGGAARKPKSQ